MNKPYKQKVSVSLDEDVIAEIKELAESDDRSFSQYINLGDMLLQHKIDILEIGRAHV